MCTQLTGLPVKLYVRMQINLALGDISSMANTEYCSNQVLPLVWTEIVSMAGALRNNLY